MIYTCGDIGAYPGGFDLTDKTNFGKRVSINVTMVAYVNVSAVTIADSILLGENDYSMIYGERSVSIVTEEEQPLAWIHFSGNPQSSNTNSETHDIDLRSISQASLPTPLSSNPSITTLRNVKSLSDLSQTLRLDLSLANIQDEKAYVGPLMTSQDQVTTKQRNRCVFEWLEAVEKKTYFLPTT
uniref:Malectin-like domain-containing protein n=1 Tax=Setaria digitata TaxID=48799 RepID=A0A915PQA6_9BILA